MARKKADKKTTTSKKGTKEDEPTPGNAPTQTTPRVTKIKPLEINILVGEPTLIKGEDNKPCWVCPYLNTVGLQQGPQGNHLEAINFKKALEVGGAVPCNNEVLSCFARFLEVMS